jgi:hypothetical protein
MLFIKKALITNTLITNSYAIYPNGAIAWVLLYKNFDGQVYWQSSSLTYSACRSDYQARRQIITTWPVTFPKWDLAGHIFYNFDLKS